MLLNIDKPTKRAVFHRLGTGCSHVPKRLGTEFKLVGEMGRDGGWFAASTERAAAEITKREAPHLTVQPCAKCST